MSLSQLYESVRHRRGGGGCGSQARQHAGQVESSVEAVGEFSQIPRQMLGPDGVIGSMHRILDVAQHRIHPCKVFAVAAPGRPAGIQWGMGATGALDGAKARQCIRTHVAAGFEMTAAPAADLAGTKAFDPIHAHGQRLVAHRIGRYRRHERRLAARAAPALVTAASAAPVSVVHLDHPGQSATLLALQHRLHELVLHEPGAVVADAQLPHQFQCRNAILRLGEQVHRQEPGGERQFRAGEQGAGGKRSLPPAAVALIQPAAEQAMTTMAALGTDEPLRPAPDEQRLLALRLGTKPRHEFAQTHAPLKLNFVLRHRLSPWKIKQCQFATLTGSLAEPHE